MIYAINIFQLEQAISIEISDTARRYGIEDEDVLHAFRNAIQANWDSPEQVTRTQIRVPPQHG